MNRTKYVIRLAKLDGNVYLKNHPSGHQWTTEIAEAVDFDTMTGANAYAIMELGLAVEDYTVEPFHFSVV